MFCVFVPGSGSSSPPNQPLLYTVAPKYSPLAWMRGGERFPLGANLFVEHRGERQRLLKDFAASADANISFDGERVLFAGKRGGRDHWQVWELSYASKQVKQITSCAEDCVRPMYLPEERYVYAHKVGGRFLLEVAPFRGGSALALSYAPGNYMPTDILRDGRVLLEASYPLGAGSTPEIYTMYTDGSGFESYRCDHGRARFGGRQVESGDVVFARTRGLGRFTSAVANEVEVIDPTLSQKARKSGVPGKDFHHKGREGNTKDTKVNALAAGEYAGEVIEIGAGEWLVSRRAANGHFELVRIRDGGRADSFAADSSADILQPVLMASRPVANRHPSALHDWDYANLLCLNAYTSKYKFADGAIASVRLYTQDSHGADKLLGSAMVEQDGSFYLRTPADQPLKIELVDAEGKILKKEAGWFWLRKGEQRICVGCHAGPETAPENAVPIVLQRSVIATDLTGSKPQAVQGGH